MATRSFSFLRLHAKRLPWIIWSILLIYVVLQFTLQNVAGVMAEAWMHDFSIDATGIGQLSSSFFYTYVLFQIPCGLLLDRYRARRVLIIATFTCALGCFLFSFTTHLGFGIATRALMGAGASFAFVGLLYVIASWFKPRLFGILISISDALGMIFTAIGIPIFSLLTDTFNWQVAMQSFGVFAVLICVLIIFFLRDRPIKNHSTAPATLQKNQFYQSFKFIVTYKQLWLNGICSGLLFSVVTVFTSLWGVPFLQQAYQLDMGFAALLNGLLFVGLTIGGPIAGFVAERIKRRKVTLMVGSIGTLIGLIIILYVPNLPISLLAVLLVWVGMMSSVYMQNFAVAHELVPASVNGVAMGFTNMLCMSGALLLQPLTGYILTLLWDGQMHNGIEIYQLSDYRIALTILPLCYLFAILGVWRLKETHCQIQVEGT